MFGVSRSMGLLMFMYFIQGLPYGLQVGFLPLFRRSKGHSLTQISLFKLLLMPWFCKMIWAPMVDSWGRKQIWLLGSILGLTITCIGMAFYTDHEEILLVGVMLLFLNVFTSIQDIAVDALAIDILSVAELGRGNTIQVVCYKIGSIFGGGILLSLHHVIGWKGVFCALACVYAEAAIFVWISPLLNDESSVTANTLHNDTTNTSHNTNDCGHHHHSHGSVRWPCKNLSCGYNELSDTDVTPNTSVEKDRLLSRTLSSPGTMWMLGYLVLYKIGEQGALNMLPLYLMDRVPTLTAGDMGVWTGMVGQSLSICGSLAGGYLVSRKDSIPVLPVLLSSLCLSRLMPLGVMLLAVATWSSHYTSFYYGCAIMSLCILYFLGGVLTTITFTAMMLCSKTASASVRATHFSLLSTVEVFGKLVLVSLSGYLVDNIGYTLTFQTFVIVSVILQFYMSYAPRELFKNVKVS